jgi:site-specific recombinase XerC
MSWVCWSILVGCDDIWDEECRCTYQRAMNLIFHDLIGVIMEVYIDDIVIKSAAHKSHLADLCLAFERMHRYGLKMNPLKCVFGVSARKFLDFIIHDKGIEVNPERIEKIKGVQTPTCKKDLQKFLRKVNYLRRFIVNLSGKIIPFTPILKLKDESKFTWGQNNKKHLKR